MHDGRLQSSRRLQQLRVRTGAARAGEDRHTATGVEQSSELFQLRRGRSHGRQRRIEGDPMRIRRPFERYVAGNRYDGNSAAPDGAAERNFEHAWRLMRLRDRLAIVAAIL